MTTHNPEHKPHKVNNALLGVIAIFAIFLLVYFAISFKINAANTTPTMEQNTVTQNVDYTGQALGVVAQDVMSCELLVGQTTVYDANTLAVTLETGATTYYAGNVVSVAGVNTDGCVVNIGDASDYLAVGQVQRVGSLYVTVKSVLQ